MAKRAFGSLRKLPSKRWQASYTGPNGGRHKAHSTFVRRSDAEAWLAAEEKLIDDGGWTPPASRDPYAVAKQSMTLADYIEQTIQAREKRSRKPLKPSTATAYRQVARLVIAPTLGDHDLASLTPQAVRAWWSELPGDKPTQNGHAYDLLRSVLNDAVDEGLLSENPCRIKGADKPAPKREPKIITPDVLMAYLQAVDPDYLALISLIIGCSLRSSEG